MRLLSSVIWLVRMTHMTAKPADLGEAGRHASLVGMT